MSSKKKVVFNEYNVLMANSVYLPLVSGQLQAFAQTHREIDDNFQFMPFNFFRDHPEALVDRHDDPAVAAFSVSMWNSNLSLEVAKRVKERFPKTTIVFGGPQVPHRGEAFLEEHDYIDVITRGDGEQTFSGLLERILETGGSTDFREIPGITFRNKGEIIRVDEEHQPAKDLDIYPSPYLSGVFDYLVGSSDIDLQAIIETNRGCPFPCSFCFWGQGGLNMKSRFFSVDRVKATAEWLGENKINYVFCADANFGMFKNRDPDIARIFSDVKGKYGFPKKFRVCFGKNAQESIFETATALHSAGLELGITLARQSNDEETLVNIRRSNIKMSVYDELQRRYNERGIPTYTELILGLPGETYDTFSKGLEEILQSSVNNQTFVYHCQVYPNTQMADPEYQRLHGIQTKRIPLTEIHGSVRDASFVDEDEDIIVATNAMPVEDWKRATTLSWVSQMFHGLKLGFHLTNYLAKEHDVKYTDFFEHIAEGRMQTSAPLIRAQVERFNEKSEALLHGGPRCNVLPEFGNVYWDNEVAGYLHLSHDKPGLNAELLQITREFLTARGVKFDDKRLEEVVRYQEARGEDYKPIGQFEFRFGYNIPEYFESYLTDAKVPLVRKPQVMTLDSPKDYDGDKEAFAREAVMWSRRSNKMERQVKWVDVA